MRANRLATKIRLKNINNIDASRDINEFLDSKEFWEFNHSVEYSEANINYQNKREVVIKKYTQNLYAITPEAYCCSLCSIIKTIDNLCEKEILITHLCTYIIENIEGTVRTLHEDELKNITWNNKHEYVLLLIDSWLDEMKEYADKMSHTDLKSVAADISVLLLYVEL